MALHPLGEGHLEALLAMARLAPPGRVLDMGAGAGESLARLSALGFDALGIDKEPGAAVEAGDFLRCPYGEASFDAILSECAFYASGEVEAALREAARLLKAGGKLLLGDVCFFTQAEWAARLEETGFAHIECRDVTAAWREYYLRALWTGEAAAFAPRPKGQKAHYYLTVCERR